MANYNHPLTAGWNMVAYMGKTLPIEQAVASIVDVLTIVWHGALFYDPGDLAGSDLHQMVYGEAYWIQVTQAVTWTYPLPGEPNGNGPPPSGLCEIVSVSGVPAQAEYGEEIAISVVVRNTSSSVFCQCHVQASSVSALFNMEPDYLNLGAGAEGTTICSVTMPNEDMSFSVFAEYWDGTQWVQGPVEGPYNVILSGGPPLVGGLSTSLLIAAGILGLILVVRRK